MRNLVAAFSLSLISFAAFADANTAPSGVVVKTKSQSKLDYRFGFNDRTVGETAKYEIPGAVAFGTGAFLLRSGIRKVDVDGLMNAAVEKLHDSKIKSDYASALREEKILLELEKLKAPKDATLKSLLESSQETAANLRRRIREIQNPPTPPAGVEPLPIDVDDVQRLKTSLTEADRVVARLTSTAQRFDEIGIPRQALDTVTLDHATTFLDAERARIGNTALVKSALQDVPEALTDAQKQPKLKRSSGLVQDEVEAKLGRQVTDSSAPRVRHATAVNDEYRGESASRKLGEAETAARTELKNFDHTTNKIINAKTTYSTAYETSLKEAKRILGTELPKNGLGDLVPKVETATSLEDIQALLAKKRAEVKLAAPSTLTTEGSLEAVLSGTEANIAARIRQLRAVATTNLRDLFPGWETTVNHINHATTHEQVTGFIENAAIYRHNSLRNVLVKDVQTAALANTADALAAAEAGQKQLLEAFIKNKNVYVDEELYAQFVTRPGSWTKKILGTGLMLVGFGDLAYGLIPEDKLEKHFPMAVSAMESLEDSAVVAKDHVVRWFSTDKEIHGNEKATSQPSKEHAPSGK